MKIVINTCYGGFSLSPKAESMYAELMGKKAYFYKQIQYGFKNEEGDKYERLDNPERDLFIYTLYTDLGKTTPSLDNSEWLHSSDIPRDDKNLIKVVETLGIESYGALSQLKIVEVPDGTQWEIDEYDGRESVNEKHKSWF